MKHDWSPLLDKKTASYFVPGHLPKARRYKTISQKKVDDDDRNFTDFFQISKVKKISLLKKKMFF